MRGQNRTHFGNPMDQSVGEFLATKMGTHLIYDPLPECFTAFFVDRLIADDGKFSRSWRDKD